MNPAKLLVEVHDGVMALTLKGDGAASLLSRGRRRHAADCQQQMKAGAAVTGDPRKSAPSVCLAH